MNQFQKNIALVLTVALVGLLVWQLYNQPKAGTKEIIYSDMTAFLDKGEISEVTIQGDSITGKFTNGNVFKTFAPKDDKLVAQFREKGVKITAKPIGGFAVVNCLDFLGSDDSSYRCLDILYATDAIRRRQSNGLRQEQGAFDDR